MKRMLLHYLSSIEIALRKSFATVIKPSLKRNRKEYVSIILVVYNGVEYTRQCIDSLKNTSHKHFEIVVVNNASDLETTQLLRKMKHTGQIDKLVQLKTNKFFSGGNNTGEEVSDPRTTHVLLLNSDTRVLQEDWLTVLLDLARSGGVTSFGYATLPFRPDGWCILISRSTYKKLQGISLKFKMNWGITDMVSRALEQNFTVRAVINSEKYIMHYGGKSYTEKTRRFQDDGGNGVFDFLFKANWLKVEGLILQE